MTTSFYSSPLRTTMNLVKGQSGKLENLTLTFVFEGSIVPPVQPHKPNGPEILPETEYHLMATIKNNSEEFILQSSDSVHTVGDYRISLINESMDHDQITVMVSRDEGITVPT
jgi:hypothetical protein